MTYLRANGRQATAGGGCGAAAAAAAVGLKDDQRVPLELPADLVAVEVDLFNGPVRLEELAKEGLADRPVDGNPGQVDFRRRGRLRVGVPSRRAAPVQGLALEPPRRPPALPASDRRPRGPFRDPRPALEPLALPEGLLVLPPDAVLPVPAGLDLGREAAGPVPLPSGHVLQVPAEELAPEAGLALQAPSPLLGERLRRRAAGSAGSVGRSLARGERILAGISTGGMRLQELPPEPVQDGLGSGPALGDVRGERRRPVRLAAARVEGAWIDAKGTVAAIVLLLPVVQAAVVTHLPSFAVVPRGIGRRSPSEAKRQIGRVHSLFSGQTLLLQEQGCCYRSRVLAACLVLDHCFDSRFSRRNRRVRRTR
jgi:hypothetical protein